MTRIPGAVLLGCMLAAATPVSAQIRVDPNGVNVNSQNATTVFLTFGGLGDYQPVEAAWCGQLIPAAPDIGSRCDPDAIFGRLPVRFDQSRIGPTGGFTDIMSIPPSVARRAYQAAEQGANSAFFYVRRFVSASGGPDQYVAVTCRMTGGGARTPLSLTDVRISFKDEDAAILVVHPGGRPPQARAEITYNGTGRLQGRWEVVLPGEELPEPRDLLTEATLPVEERGTQRRYAPLARFNVFLPPAGRIVLESPADMRLPANVEGQYMVLLRVEASADKEGDSNLATAGAGVGIVHSGGVAGFPLPVLRYVVSGSAVSDPDAAGPGAAREGYTIDRSTDGALLFNWPPQDGGTTYRLEWRDAADAMVLTALVPGGWKQYQAPPMLEAFLQAGDLRWRVVTLAISGNILARGPWVAVRAARLPND
jgi:hypothetical protein